MISTRLAKLSAARGIQVKPHVHYADRLADFPRNMLAGGQLLLGERLGIGGFQGIEIDHLLDKHLLVAVQDAKARAGTLMAMIASLRQSMRFGRIVALSVSDESGMLRDHVDQLDADLKVLVGETHASQPGKPKLLIVGPIENSSGLGQQGIGERRRITDSEGPQLGDLLLDGQNEGLVILAWTMSWRAMTRTVDTRKYLNAFDLRIASGMSADDCQVYFGRRQPAISKVRGLAIDLSQDISYPFKPFGFETFERTTP